MMEARSTPGPGGTVNLQGYIGRRWVDVEEELKARDVEMAHAEDALTGPLSLFAGPTNTTEVAPGARVVAYVSEGRVTRFQVDRAGTQRLTFDRQAIDIAGLRERIDALQALVDAQKGELETLRLRVDRFESQSAKEEPAGYDKSQEQQKQPRRGRRQNPPTAS